MLNAMLLLLLMQSHNNVTINIYVTLPVVKPAPELKTITLLRETKDGELVPVSDGINARLSFYSYRQDYPIYDVPIKEGKIVVPERMQSEKLNIGLSHYVNNRLSAYAYPGDTVIFKYNSEVEIRK